MAPGVFCHTTFFGDILIHDAIAEVVSGVLSARQI